MDRKNMRQEERREYINRLQYILKYNKDIPIENQFILIRDFAEFLTHNYNEGSIYALSELFNKDMTIALELLYTIQDFCVKHKIHFNKVFDLLLVLSVIQIDNLNESFKKEERKRLDTNRTTEDTDSYINLKKDIINIYENKEDLPALLKKRFLNIVEYAKSTGNITKDDLIVYQMVLFDSYDEIKRQVIKNSKNINLPLDQYQINPMKCLSEIDYERNQAFSNLFTPRALGQMKIGNHYMSYILNDKMVKVGGKVVFKGHTKALSIGYTQKAIVLSLDKNTTIRELETGLKYLKKQENVQEVIIFNKKLIEIIRQQNPKVIPFKALAKEVGLSKNQAKQYAKQLYESIHLANKTIENNFDKIIIHDFTK